MQKNGIIAILTIGMVTLPCFAAVNTQLSQLNQHIQSIQTDLQKAAHQKNQLQTALKNTELSESQMTRQLEKTTKDLTQTHQNLTMLSKNSRQLTTEIQTRKTALETQIRAAFLLSQQPLVKLALDADTLTQYQHLLTYFRFLTKTQTDNLQQLQTALMAYQRNQTRRDKEYHQLLSLKKLQLQNQQALQHAHNERKALIQNIEKHIKTKHQKLEQLIRDKKHLEKTLTELNKKSLQQPRFKGAFAKLQGKLSWPVQGRVRHLFGTQINQSELRWTGTLIDAPAGKPIHAIAPGQVVFAKWLSGYGLLIIVDHGDGYMTLYGRNQSLLKHEGDWVNSNDVIATAGKTGGFDQTALYFGIRHNAEPVNPEKWCRS